MNIRLDIQYDGTAYKGWQRQNHAPSIQEEIEGAILKSLGKDVKLTVAGRTDAGVHAYRQVANFKAQVDRPVDKLSYWINSRLAKDIRILSSKGVDEDFHARFSAKKKTYVYKFYNGKDLHPIYRNHCQQVYRLMDYEKMKRASELFLGLHDFTSFSANLAPDTNTTRAIDRIELTGQAPWISLEFEGESFLRNQIRIIAGTIMQVGRGKIALDEIPKIFEAKDRTKAGPTLTGSGLYLMDIKY